ncbi:MAG: hypothetical protein J6W39_01590, partial [Spirochaetales bacterium]|nr:hypothetical protein [Spirochaetales bacterium]
MLVEEIQSFFFPFFNSVVIFAMNEGDRMDNSSDNTRNKDCNCPDKELFLKHMNMFSRSLGILCDCFLARANDCDEDPLWKKFYRIQMSIYLIAKKNLEISEPEGDMV